MRWLEIAVDGSWDGVYGNRRRRHIQMRNSSGRPHAGAMGYLEVALQDANGDGFPAQSTQIWLDGQHGGLALQSWVRREISSPAGSASGGSGFIGCPRRLYAGEPTALRCWKHSRQNTGRPCVGRKGTVVSFPHCEQVVLVSDLCALLLWPWLGL